MNVAVTTIVTIIIFMLIIMIHEFGHFIAAKALKVKVHEFSIGFGPSIYKKQGKETLYNLRIFPIGGFVSLEGEDTDSDDPNALCKKPIWARFLVMAAGAAFNIISGFIVFVIFFAMQPQMPTLEIGSLSTVIPNAPAPQVLQAGDVITSFNGDKVSYYRDFSFKVSTECDGSPVQVTVNRGGQNLSFEMTPVLYEGSYKLGFTPAYENMTFLNTIKYGFMETGFVVKIVFYSLKMLITGQAAVTDMSGPVGTGVIISEATQQGIGKSMPNLMSIFSLLAVNVGIFNLLPFPALDGGRIFFLLVEFIRRKPIPPEKEGMVHFIGLALLMLLMIFVTSSDILKLFR